ncbi:MAG: hypothetical protein EA374_04520 [Acholeplasmatales bacterium]|nr:MAG: hypothetical protein EA374_04520 [Acholeplasmatales bacterium]
MKRFNHYQKDILFILLLIGLQTVFSIFSPFMNPDQNSPVEVSRSFIALRFEIINTGDTFMYVPFLSMIFAGLLVMLLMQKRRRFALIYGFALVLVTKAYYLVELYALDGRYDVLVASGIFGKRILSNGMVLAQDVSFYVLLALLVVKVSIYVHDMVMAKKARTPSS